VVSTKAAGGKFEASFSVDLAGLAIVPIFSRILASSLLGPCNEMEVALIEFASYSVTVVDLRSRCFNGATR
jgi:hypothetical protein